MNEHRVRGLRRRTAKSGPTQLEKTSKASGKFPLGRGARKFLRGTPAASARDGLRRRVASFINSDGN